MLKQKASPPIPSTPPQANRAALYARVSTREQKTRQTIDTQLHLGREFCEKQGFILYQIYQDRAVSGELPLEDRQEGKRFLDDAKAGKFQVCIVYDLTRLGRDYGEICIATGLLKRYGVKVLSITEGAISSDSTADRVLLTVKAEQSEQERLKFRRRSMDAVNRLVREGRWFGATSPFGYRKGTDHQLAIYPEEAAIVVRMYRWIGEDRLSCFEVARRLNEKGTPTRAHVEDGLLRRQDGSLSGQVVARKWTATRVYNLLSSTTYKGLHVYGKRQSLKVQAEGRNPVEREVPAIISPELWQRTREQLSTNAKLSKRQAKRDYLLRSLMFCGFCGRRMIAFTSNGTWRYYRCNFTLSAFANGDPPCPMRIIPAQWIEDHVWHELASWITGAQDVSKIVAESLADQSRHREELRSVLQDLREQLKEIDTQRDKLIRFGMKGLIGEEELAVRLGELKIKRGHIEAKIEEREKRSQLQISPEAAQQAAREQVRQFRNAIKSGDIPFSQKEEIVRMFVRGVSVRLRKGEEIGALAIVETIPYGADKSHLGDEDERITLWTRDSSVPTTTKRTIKVDYHFPFPANTRKGTLPASRKETAAGKHQGHR